MDTLKILLASNSFWCAMCNVAILAIDATTPLFADKPQWVTASVVVTNLLFIAYKAIKGTLPEPQAKQKGA